MKNKIAIDIQTEDATSFTVHRETDKPVQSSVQSILRGSDLEEAMTDAIDGLVPVPGRCSLIVLLIPDET